jgi:pullulanase/glycogen debranching enzyme
VKPVSTINSMKEMVKTMHANGIEVIMEVVFSNTAETVLFKVLIKILSILYNKWSMQFGER